MTAWTAAKIKATKGKEKLACLTAYDYATAQRVDEAGIPLVLVGDSLAMTVLGHESTLPVTMDEMIHHTKAVVRGVEQALVVADMPFMSFQASQDEAVTNAGRFIKEAGAGAVKIEGGAQRAELTARLVDIGIPVMGHIGLTPQRLLELGKYRVEGRAAADADRIRADAEALEKAGIFALVLECLPAELGADVSAKISVPTIGIGAGPGCDGQILVIHDMLGLQTRLAPKFVKRYAELGEEVAAALSAYRREVQEGTYPGEEHCY
jgi:3-methyl-2-oxobutanoate hydroxymethyltransferase